MRSPSYWARSTTRRGPSAVFGEGDPDDLQFVAADFTLIDSQYAIDSYTEVTAFRDYR